MTKCSTNRQSQQKLIITSQNSITHIYQQKSITPSTIIEDYSRKTLPTIHFSPTQKHNQKESSKNIAPYTTAKDKQIEISTTILKWEEKRTHISKNQHVPLKTDSIPSKCIRNKKTQPSPSSDKKHKPSRTAN